MSFDFEKWAKDRLSKCLPNSRTEGKYAAYDEFRPLIDSLVEDGHLSVDLKAADKALRELGIIRGAR